MIVVIDTNVWISAFLFSAGKGTVYSATQRAIAVDTIAFSEEMEAEIANVLRESFSWPAERIDAALFDFFGNAIRVTLDGTVRLCRDRSDDKFLECAERAHADLIVTGDNDLLALKSRRRTKIVTPAEYLQLP